MAKYIKLSDAVDKFIETNARSFNTDQIVYLLNRVPSRELTIGKWKMRTIECSRENYDIVYVCSECGYKTNYGYARCCPKCNAVMMGCENE